MLSIDWGLVAPQRGPGPTIHCHEICRELQTATSLSSCCHTCRRACKKCCKHELQAGPCKVQGCRHWQLNHKDSKYCMQVHKGLALHMQGCTQNHPASLLTCLHRVGGCMVGEWFMNGKVGAGAGAGQWMGKASCATTHQNNKQS